MTSKILHVALDKFTIDIVQKLKKMENDLKTLQKNGTKEIEMFYEDADISLFWRTVILGSKLALATQKCFLLKSLEELEGKVIIYAYLLLFMI
jgi:hypothetical protein